VENGLPILLILGFVALVVVFGYLAHLAEKKRREGLRLAAKRLGLSYSHLKDRGHGKRYAFLDELSHGSNRYSYDLMTGDADGHPVSLFNHHYETYSRDSKGRRQTHHHHHNVIVLTQEKIFPEVRIYPEGFFSKIGQALGFDDIDFESVEFSNKFVVKSKDKKFAYDICHARMMEYLLKHHNSTLEIEGQSVALIHSGRYKAEQIEEMMGRIVEIRDLFPDYLYQD
jgi:hypothetical protein